MDLTVAPKSTHAGAPITLTFRVTNTNTAGGNYDIPLLVNGNPVFTASGTLGAGASRVHSTTVTRSAPGTYTVQVGDLADSFVVESASIQFSNLIVNPKTVGGGDPVTVLVTATNAGGSPGDYTATLLVDGTAAGTQTGTLTPNQKKTLVFGVSRTGAGTYTVSIGGLADSFRVLAPTLDAKVVIPPTVNIDAKSTGVDATGKTINVTGEKMTVSATEIVLPLGLTLGTNLSSFEDKASGIIVRSNGNIEIPMAKDAQGNTTLTLIAETTGVTGTGNTATAKVSKLRMVTKQQELDLSTSDPSLGKSGGFSFDATLGSLPKDASLTMTPKKTLPATAKAGFELVARGAGNTIKNVGFAIEITKSNLQNGTDVKAVTVEMAMDPLWVAAQGGPSKIQITRLADDGTLQFLPTVLAGTDAQGRMLFRALSNDGFSVFTILSVAVIPPAFAVTGLALDPQVAEPNEAVAIRAQVANQGGQSGTLTVLLKVNSKPLDTLDVTLSPGETGEAVFYLKQQEEGTYQIQVEQQTATLEISKKLSLASISYGNLSVSPKQVAPKEPVTVTVQVTNSGDTSGKADIQVLLNDILYRVTPVRLPGKLTVPVKITLAQDQPGTYKVTVGGLSDTFTVVKPLAKAVFAVSKLDVRPAEVKAGERVTIVATVANTGDVQGTFDVVLLINGKQEAKETVTLEGKGVIPVIFDVTKKDPGDYTVQVEGLIGTFRVLRVPAAAFTLSELQVSAKTVEASQQVTITVKVSNSGDAAGSRTVTLKINGTVEATKDVTVSAGAAQTVSFSISKGKAGVYNVDIDGQTSSFEVTAAPGAPIGLIIGILAAALIVIGAAVYFFVLRRKPTAGPTS